MKKIYPLLNPIKFYYLGRTNQLFMKIFLFPFLTFISIFSFSQNIELVAHENEIKDSRPYHITQFKDGFIMVNPFYIQIYDAQSKLIKTKSWKSIKFSELKYDLVEKKNTSNPNPSFKPMALKKIPDGVITYVYYEPSEGDAKIVEYRFTEELELISEKVITQMEQKRGYSKHYAHASMDFFISKESDHFVLAQYSISSKETNNIHNLEYKILNFDFTIVESGSCILPEYNFRYSIAEVPQYALKSIEVLSEGDPYINLGGRLYLIHSNNVLPLEISPQKEVSSYKLKQDKNGALVLIGTYFESQKEVQTGLVIMRFDDELNVVSEEYLEFHSDFYLTPTELINKRFSYAFSNKNELGLKTKGSLLKKGPSVIIDAKLNEDGTIHAVFHGVAQYGNAGNCPQNISMVKINSDNVIEAQNIFPYEFTAHQVGTQIQNFKAFFNNNQIYLLTTDYPQNYDSSGNYKPALDPIPFLNSLVSTVSLYFNTENEESRHNRITLNENHERTPIIIETEVFPNEQSFILTTNFQDKKWNKRFYSFKLD
jgi:hypothetical protein